MQQDSDVQKKPTLFSLIDLIFLLNSKVLHFFFHEKVTDYSNILCRKEVG